MLLLNSHPRPGQEFSLLSPGNNNKKNPHPNFPRSGCATTINALIHSSQYTEMLNVKLSLFSLFICQISKYFFYLHLDTSIEFCHRLNLLKFQIMTPLIRKIPPLNISPSPSCSRILGQLLKYPPFYAKACPIYQNLYDKQILKFQPISSLTSPLFVLFSSESYYFCS